MARMNEKKTPPVMLINHVVFVIDESDSMGGKEKDVIKLVDSQVKDLAKMSEEMGQETRVSVYTFSSYNEIQCIIFDRDVLRLPSLEGYYQPHGMTALMDATGLAVSDLKKMPELYGDHAFLLYVVTDGHENNSVMSSGVFRDKVTSLPENWTMVVFVPDANGADKATRYGFPKQNIAIWDTRSEKGVEQVDTKMRAVTQTYMSNRAAGVRGSSAVFVDTKNLTTDQVKANLRALRPAEYVLLKVKEHNVPLAEMIDKAGHKYITGRAFYELIRPETLGGHKIVAVMDKNTNKVYYGDNARKLLGLPDTNTRIRPGDFGDFRVFVQSQADNRLARNMVGTGKNERYVDNEVLYLKKDPMDIDGM